MLNRKILLIFCFLFIGVHFSVYAETNAEDQFNLVGQYGKDLQKVPFAIKFKYEKETGKLWKDTTLYRRKTFLTEWHTQKAADIAKEKEKAARLAKAQREKEKAKQAADRIKANKLRDEQRAEAEKRRQELAERRSFERAATEQRKKIDNLRREQERSTRR